MTTTAPQVRTNRGFGVFAVFVLGVASSIIGLILAGGGAWLLSLGGSPYYLSAGIGLGVVGILLMRRRPEAIAVYIVIFVLTVIWALWEVGPDLWALVPRIVAPAVLLVLILLSLPVYNPAHRTVAFASVGVVLVLRRSEQAPVLRPTAVTR